jgi:3',5'-cyclic AMP phosphodiesterase CpdA
VANRILVIDDEWNLPERRNGYLSLESASREHTPHYPIKIDFAAKPLDVPVMLRSAVYSAALVDVKLDSWGCPLRTITDFIDDALPICLVSKRWNDTTSDDVNDAWRRKNCRTFFHWSEIGGDTGKVKVLMQLNRILAEAKGQDDTVVLGENESAFILHLSDLHIRAGSEADRDLEISRAAEEIRRACRNRAPTFVAITGDVAQHGFPSEYRSAEHWLRKLFSDMEFGNPPTPRLLLVPGNHDVCLPLAFSSRVGIVKSGEHRMELVDSGNDIPDQLELTGSALDPYRQFATKLSGRSTSSWDDQTGSLAWIEGRFRHLGIIFFGMNTARPFSSRTEAGREVDPRGLGRIADQLRELSHSGEGAPVVVGMSHHCPTGDVGDRSVTNPDAFTLFFNRDIKAGIFLHGHVHERRAEYNSRFKLIRCCAPTMNESARPVDTLRGFSVIEIERTNYKPTKIGVTCFDWRQSDLEVSKVARFVRRRNGTFIPEELTSAD